MTSVSVASSRPHPRLFSRFYAVDLPYFGQLNIETGRRGRRSFFGASSDNGGRYLEAWAGPVRVEFDYMPQTRAKRGTAVLAAVAAVVVSGWTRGHC